VGESIENPSFHGLIDRRALWRTVLKRQRSFDESCLLDPGAAALYQNHQHENKEYTGNYPDNCGTIHSIPLSTAKFTSVRAILTIRSELQKKPST